MVTGRKAARIREQHGDAVTEPMHHVCAVARRCIVAALAVGVSAPAQAQSRSIAIERVNVVDVARGTIVPDQTVIVERDRITAVVPAATAQTPPNALRVAGSGKFLIPGLWDAHVHVIGWELDRLLLPLLVANGVTSVRDMFGELGAAEATRRRVLDGAVLGPRIISSGHILDGRPAIWNGSVSVADSAGARHAVDSLASHGAPFIKVYSRLTEDELRAVADEARRHHLRFAGHVPMLVSAATASDLGQASVEHLTGMLSGCSTVDDDVRGELRAAVASRGGWNAANVVLRRETGRILANFDSTTCSDLGRRLARNGTWLVPTTTVLHSVAFLDDTALAADPRLKYIPRAIRESWNPRSDFRFRMLTSEDWTARKRAYTRQIELIRVLHDAGVSFLAGTDLGNPFTFAGFSLHEELARLVDAGLTPAEALRAATLGPASFMQLADSLGTVERGKVADLVLLDANPLTDIRNTTRIAAVVLRGKLLERDELDDLLRKAERLASSRPRR